MTGSHSCLGLIEIFLFFRHVLGLANLIESQPNFKNNNYVGVGFDI